MDAPRIITTRHGRDVEHRVTCHDCGGFRTGSDSCDDPDACRTCGGQGSLACDDCSLCAALLCDLGAECGCGTCAHCLVLQSHQLGPVARDVVERRERSEAEGRERFEALLRRLAQDIQEAA